VAPAMVLSDVVVMRSVYTRHAALDKRRVSGDASG
jgi:hypothetical protein